MAVNVLGTWHVLLAAEAAGAGRVISFSSAQVFGIAEGERLPDYFPVDDAHPRRAMRPYGLSKRLGEDLCEGFTRADRHRHGLPAAGGSLGPGPVRPGPGPVAHPAALGVGAVLGVRRVRGRPRRRRRRRPGPDRPAGTDTTGSCCAPPASPRPRPASTWSPGSLPACRSPTQTATAPIPGLLSSTARPPRPRSGGGPPTSGHLSRTRPSHNIPRGRCG